MAPMRAFLLSLLVAAVALAGCAGDDPDPDPGNGDPDPTNGLPNGDDDGDVDPGPRGPVDWPVTLEGNSFRPGSLTVQAGDTVRWIHQDGDSPHTVTSEDAGFESHPDCDGTLEGIAGVDLLGQCMGQDDTFEHTFSQEGTFEVSCRVHGGMSMSVTVLERYDEIPDTAEPEEV